jgi:rSAM/selenodomain-associated transferase 1
VRILTVLAKAPRPGLSKTRLARDGTLTQVQAAEFARAFLVDTLASCAQAAVERWNVAFSPADARAEFEELAPGVELELQAEGDLGTRMRAAFEAAFARGGERVVVVGADAPQIGVQRLEAAFAALEGADLVLGPARDGGYYLVGLRALRGELFEGVAWSTPSVRAQTLEAAARLGLRARLLDELDDIDGPEELERLRSELVQNPSLCPATSRAFARLATSCARSRPGRSAS